LDPSKRPSMEDVLNHPWMNGECPSNEEVFQDMNERMKTYKENIEN